MTLKIYKFPIDPGYNNLSLPDGYQILSVGLQKDKTFIWVLLDTDKYSPHNFPTTGIYAALTGEKLPTESFNDTNRHRFIGTTISDQDGLPFVMHVFKIY